MAVLRVQTHLGVLSGGESPWLVEDRVRDQQLSDVVQQSGPLELIELVGAEPELLTEQSTVRTHSFRVTTGGTVVDAQRGDELEYPLGSLGWCSAQLASARLGDALVELACRAVAQRDAKAWRCAVRKREAQRQQRCQRYEPAGDSLSGDQHQRRGRGDQQPTGDGACERRRHGRH